MSELQVSDTVRLIATSDLLTPHTDKLGVVTMVEHSSDGTQYVWVTFEGGGYASHVPADEFERVSSAQ